MGRELRAAGGRCTRRRGRSKADEQHRSASPETNVRGSAGKGTGGNGPSRPSQGAFLSQAGFRVAAGWEAATRFSSHLSSRGFWHSEQANVKLARDGDSSAETGAGKMHAR